MLRKKKAEFLICDSDLEATLSHLREDPMSYAANMPEPWSKTLLMKHIVHSLSESKDKDFGATFRVLHSVWAHIVPVGVDLVRFPRHDNQRQIILSFRNVHTVPEALVSVG